MSNHQIRLLAFLILIGGLLLAPLTYTLRLPGKLPKLWELWPNIHNFQYKCWECSKIVWGEDAFVGRTVWGDFIIVCGDCNAKETGKKSSSTSQEKGLEGESV